MANDETDIPKGTSAKSDWDAGVSPSAKARSFFQPDDFDIYVNKINGSTYIFHGPPLPAPVERLEYNTAENRVNVIAKDGRSFDLGVKIQWLVRPYFKKAHTVFIVQTKNGETIDGIEVPLVMKGEQ